MTGRTRGMHAPADVVWLAGADREAHAQPKHATGADRTLCGLRLVRERDAWPPLRRCSECRLRLDRREAS